MMVSVRPSFKDGITRVNMAVLGRRAEDIDEFMEKLEATGSFEEIVPAGSEKTDEGLHRTNIESVYVGHQLDAAMPTSAKPHNRAPKSSCRLNCLKARISARKRNCTGSRPRG